MPPGTVFVIALEGGVEGSIVEGAPYPALPSTAPAAVPAVCETGRSSSAATELAYNGTITHQ